MCAELENKMRGYKSVVCTIDIPSCLVGRTQLSSPAPSPSSGPDSPSTVENINLFVKCMTRKALTRQEFL